MSGIDPVERAARERETAAEVALGNRTADLILTNGRLVDVHTARIRPADIAVSGTRFAAVGAPGSLACEAHEVFDCGGRYLLPGFVETHFHVGGSGLTIERLAEALLPLGTTALATCFFEPAVIAGADAVRELLDRADSTFLDVLFSPFKAALGPGEFGSSKVSPEEFEALVADPRVVEIREWSYRVAGLPGSAEMWRDAMRRRLTIAGHLEGLSGPELQASVALGCCSDHETVSVAEAIERAESGVIVQIREGSGTPDLRAVLPAITELGLDPSCFAFSTDQQELDSLVLDGHIDHKLRIAVNAGVPPIDAVRMATLNAARSIGVEADHGSITAGRRASVVLVDDLADFRPRRVLARGRWVGEEGSYIGETVGKPYSDAWRGTVLVEPDFGPEDFCLEEIEGERRVIGVNPGSLLTDEIFECVELDRGAPRKGSGLVAMAVIDRHRRSGRIGRALARGFGLSGGALACTVNPGVCNLMVIGDDLADMATAANRVAELQGGTVIVKKGEIIAEMALPILGIATDADLVAATEDSLSIRKAIVDGLSCPHPGILTTAMFACMPVSIPTLKLCEFGLVRVVRGTEPEAVTEGV